jgi:hypothetical protein
LVVLLSTEPVQAASGVEERSGMVEGVVDGCSVGEDVGGGIDATAAAGVGAGSVREGSKFAASANQVARSLSPMCL